MYGLAFLAWLNRRLKEIFPHNKDKLFGGLHVIIAGDMGQIKPCNEKSFFVKNHKNLSKLQIEGAAILDQFKIKINLTKN